LPFLGRKSWALGHFGPVGPGGQHGLPQSTSPAAARPPWRSKAPLRRHTVHRRHRSNRGTGPWPRHHDPCGNSGTITGRSINDRSIADVYLLGSIRRTDAVGGLAPGGPAKVVLLNTQARSVAFDRSRLSSRSCAAVKAQPHVPHLQLVNALVTRLGPSLLVWGWFARTARTNSPPHFEHSRFCIALVKEWVAQPQRPCGLLSSLSHRYPEKMVEIDRFCVSRRCYLDETVECAAVMS